VLDVVVPDEVIVPVVNVDPETPPPKASVIIAPVPASANVPEIEELSDVESFITELVSNTTLLSTANARIVLSSSDKRICNVADLLFTRGVNNPVPVVSIQELFKSIKFTLPLAVYLI
jgi:hypothetical protein